MKSIFQIQSLSRLDSKHLFKIYLGHLFNYSQSKRWLRFAFTNSIFRKIVIHHPYTITKPHREYACNAYTIKERLDIIVEHYAIAETLGLNRLIDDSIIRPLVIAQAKTKSNQCVTIEFIPSYEGFREGEFCFRLCINNEPVMSLNLNLTKEGSFVNLLVTRIQGIKNSNGEDVIRNATRELYSCRPHDLLMRFIRNFAHLLGCKKVLLISNSKRATVNLWRRINISCDYDSYWISIGAYKDPNGFFVIDPEAERILNVNNKKSAKRSETRKKYEMQNTLYVSLKKLLVKKSRHVCNLQKNRKQSCVIALQSTHTQVTSVHNSLLEVSN